MNSDSCPYRKNIECSYRGALIFCRHCGFYPVEERRRKTIIESNIGQIEEKRPKNIMQLRIVHKGKKVSYSVQAVRKTHRQSKNQQLVDYPTGCRVQSSPDQTRPDQTRPE